MIKGHVILHLISGENLVQEFSSNLEEDKFINKLNLEISAGGVSEVPSLKKEPYKDSAGNRRRTIVNWITVQWYEIILE